jgi:hypothetical protein
MKEEATEQQPEGANECNKVNLPPSIDEDHAEDFTTDSPSPRAPGASNRAIPPSYHRAKVE